MHKRCNISHLTLSVALLAALGTGAVAHAQDDQDDSAVRTNHLEELKNCQEIVDSAARLACFDRAVATMVAATEQGELQLVDQDAVTKTRRRLFGFSLPDLGIFSGGDGEDDELEMLESTITKVRYSRSDAFVFQIEEGDAWWRIQNAPSRLRRVEPGDTVVFKKASLGSYFIRINGQIGVKGRRFQ